MTVRPREARRSAVRDMPRSAWCPTAASRTCHTAIAASPTTTTISRDRPNGWPARVWKAPDWSLSPVGLPSAIWMASQPTARCSSPYPMNPIRVRASRGPLFTTRRARPRALLATVMALIARHTGSFKHGRVDPARAGYQARHDQPVREDVVTSRSTSVARPRSGSGPGSGSGLRRREVLQVGAVGVGALLFGVLLVLVRLQWLPLESVDHGLAAALNRAVAPHRPLVLVLGFVTRLGSLAVLIWLVAIATVLLIVRRRYRLAGYLGVAGLGSVILDPALKAAVGRLRPVVAHPVAVGGGNSFPSGHALGSIIVYSALLLVFVPALARRGP